MLRLWLLPEICTLSISVYQTWSNLETWMAAKHNTFLFEVVSALFCNALFIYFLILSNSVCRFTLLAILMRVLVVVLKEWRWEKRFCCCLLTQLIWSKAAPWLRSAFIWLNTRSGWEDKHGFCCTSKKLLCEGEKHIKSVDRFVYFSKHWNSQPPHSFERNPANYWWI